MCHHAGLELLTLSDPPASASQSARITGVSHRAQPNKVFIRVVFGKHESSVHYSPAVLGSSNPPVSTSRVARTIGMCHSAQPINYFSSILSSFKKVWALALAFTSC
uniref:Uncharacterized protein n=1 Tax=Prolemur simus TaxID=1328070 RepID=A0A8C8YRE5_PROSS